MALKGTAATTERCRALAWTVGLSLVFVFAPVRANPLKAMPIDLDVSASSDSALSDNSIVCERFVTGMKADETIHFAPGQTSVRGDANLDRLNLVARAVQTCPGIQLAINGHSSGDGPSALNLALSNARADAVLAYLTGEAGIERSRLMATGYGESEPIAPNNTREGRDRNRRIEFIFTRTD